MSHSRRVRVTLLAIVAVIGAVIAISGGGRGYAQVSATATNDLPNPYHQVENWAQLPAGIQWGQVISAQPDARGRPERLTLDGHGGLRPTRHRGLPDREDRFGDPGDLVGE